MNSFKKQSSTGSEQGSPKQRDNMGASKQGLSRCYSEAGLRKIYSIDTQVSEQETERCGDVKDVKQIEANPFLKLKFQLFYHKNQDTFFTNSSSTPSLQIHPTTLKQVRYLDRNKLRQDFSTSFAYVRTHFGHPPPPFP